MEKKRMNKRGENQRFLLVRQNNKRGQIWVETIIYTLITLALIGAVLAFILPQIGEIKDRATIGQSISIMEDIDITILSIVQGGTGNKRVIDITINKGSLKINSSNDRFIFEIESNGVYSELNTDINIGNIVAKTEQTGSAYKITLRRDYNYNLTYNGGEKQKSISQASTPYKMTIENKGKDNNGNTVIDIIIS